MHSFLTPCETNGTNPEFLLYEIAVHWALLVDVVSAYESMPCFLP